jgi:hypothetical protein
MQPTNRLRTITIATCATLVLVLTGIRCTSAPQSAPTDTPKIPVYAQKRVIDRVDWPASSTINQTALKAMKPEEAAKIANSGVPVLVPSDEKILALSTFGSDQNGYSIGLPDPMDGRLVTLSAGRVSVQSDNPALLVPGAYEEDSGVPLRGTKVFLSQGESVTWRAQWVENGEASYMLDLDCLNIGDSLCATSDYLLSLVKNLVYVGGNGQ